MNERTAELRAAGVTDHVLVCTNDREDHAACSGAGGPAVFEEVADWLRDRDVLYSNVYVARTGCLGLCSTDGVAVVVHPRDRWFSDVTPDDVPDLMTELFGPGASRLGIGPAGPENRDSTTAESGPSPR